MSPRRDSVYSTEALSLLLAIVATFAFSLVVLLEWRLLDLAPSAAQYYFGFAVIAWAILLFLIGVWYTDRRQTREQRLREELEFAYARGDLTTEKFEERQEYLDDIDDDG